MTAVLAILRESWLALGAEKLFKAVMLLNIFVILAYMSLGFDETGVSLFFGLGHVESEFIYEGAPLATTLYQGIFSAFIVNIWLAWAASILALISTSSIFPSFLSQGSVELVMSRPTRRSTIFLVKYFGGLFFVMLQVSVFTLGAFIAAGWRIDQWDPMVFLAIPLVTVFYSYLFCVNVLVGIVTRSTLTALLATLLFWFGTFGIRTADDILTMASFEFESEQTSAQKNLDEMEAELAQAKADGETAEIERIEKWLPHRRTELEQVEKYRSMLDPWATALDAVRVVVPETARTIGLLHRAMEHDAEISFEDLINGDAFRDDAEDHRRKSQQNAEARIRQREKDLPWFDIIGRSLIFELIVLLGAMWIFQRRDF